MGARAVALARDVILDDTDGATLQPPDARRMRHDGRGVHGAAWAFPESVDAVRLIPPR